MFLKKIAQHKIGKTLASLLMLFFLCSCSRQGKNPIYHKGREFTYQVEVSKDNEILEKHKITLKVTNSLKAKLMFGGQQTGIAWVYETANDSTAGKPLTETTGVIDDSTEVSLHPPREGFMAFTEIPPFPDISLPPKIGSTANITLDVVKGGFKGLNGKKIKKVLRVTGKKKTTVLQKNYDHVWILKGENTNHLKELGQYSATYWFDEKSGFIRMQYKKPDGEIVDMKLEKIKE